MENKLADTLGELNPGNFAIGNDLVFVPNFQHSLNELFIKKVYTSAEIAYCETFKEPLLRYASTWAAKEAVYKAVKQLDAATLGWKKIEIIREKLAGRPLVILHQHGNTFNVSLTLSHDGDYVWAAAFASINK